MFAPPKHNIMRLIVSRILVFLIICTFTSCNCDDPENLPSESHTPSILGKWYHTESFYLNGDSMPTAFFENACQPVYIEFLSNTFRDHIFALDSSGSGLCQETLSPEMTYTIENNIITYVSTISLGTGAEVFTEIEVTFNDSELRMKRYFDDGVDGDIDEFLIICTREPSQ